MKSMELVNILQNYKQMSGQKINIEKSSIFFNQDSDKETRTKVIEILGLMLDAQPKKIPGFPIFNLQIQETSSKNANKYPSIYLDPLIKILQIKKIKWPLGLRSSWQQDNSSINSKRRRHLINLSIKVPNKFLLWVYNNSQLPTYIGPYLKLKKPNPFHVITIRPMEICMTLYTIKANPRPSLTHGEKSH